MTESPCKCASWIPDGYLCGDPECPRAQIAIRDLEKLREPMRAAYRAGRPWWRKVMDWVNR